MKQIFLTLWVATCVLRLPAAAADSTNASVGMGVEWLSEVIALKYARASDVAEALNYLSGQRSFLADRVKPSLQRAAISVDRPWSQPIKVTVDARSNSLLIFAGQSDLESIRRIVAKLDVALRQILIEAAVLEVRLPKGRNAGSNRPGRLPTAAADHFLGDGVHWVTNFVPVVGKLDGFSYVAVFNNDFNSMVASLLRDGGTNVDIIQKPRLLTTDGTAGSIFVGLIMSQEQLSTGLELTLTPTINADGSIAMETKASFSKVSGKTYITGVGDVPNTSTSEARAAATLHDGEVLLIGGPSRTPVKLPSGRQPKSELIVLLRTTLLSASSHPGDSR